MGQNIFKISINNFLPQFCENCEKRLSKETIPYCDECIESISHNNNMQIIDNPSEYFGYESFYNTMYYSYFYRTLIKKIFKKAKFEHHNGCQKFIFEQNKKILTNLCEKYNIIFMASSRDFLIEISKMMKKKKTCNIHFPFYKRSEKIIAKKKNREKRFLLNYDNLLLKDALSFDIEKPYILIDDVASTGSTINQGARLLVMNGIPREKIYALAFFLNPVTRRDYRNPRQ